jgi:hypothetical protein
MKTNGKWKVVLRGWSLDVAGVEKQYSQWFEHYGTCIVSKEIVKRLVAAIDGDEELERRVYVNPRNKEILKLALGPAAYKEIGEKFRISRQRARECAYKTVERLFDDFVLRSVRDSAPLTLEQSTTWRGAVHRQVNLEDWKTEERNWRQATRHKCLGVKGD